MTAILYPMAIYSPEGAMSIVHDDEERAAVESMWTPAATGDESSDTTGLQAKRGPGRPKRVIP